MGQKTHPVGFRLGISKDWKSRYYAGRDLPALLREDELLRKYLKARLGHAAIADIVIDRKPGKVVVTLHTGRPGVVIGKKGAEVDKLRDELAHLTGKEVGINVEEIKRPELDAQLVADNIASQLAQRISFRRAMKRAVQSAMRMGAQGIKVKAGGRLGGAEIARVEGYHEGRVPLHTLRADIVIDRKPGKVVVTLHTGRPGVVIGKKGAEVDKLRDELAHLTGKEVGINVEEIKRPELDAQLVADNIASQLAQRISFRRAMKRAVQSAMRMGAQGIKVKAGGRLGGAEIARVEGYHEGRVPLHTLRADIDYATSTAKTTFGAIGVKVWIFKGEKVDERRGSTYSTAI